MIRKIKKEVGCSFKENIQYMDQTLPVEKSFDIIRREMEIGGKESVFYYIDGFIKDEAMLKIMDSFLSVSEQDMPKDYGFFSFYYSRRSPTGCGNFFETEDSLCRSGCVEMF